MNLVRKHATAYPTWREPKELIVCPNCEAEFLATKAKELCPDCKVNFRKLLKNKKKKGKLCL